MGTNPSLEAWLCGWWCRDSRCLADVCLWASHFDPAFCTSQEYTQNSCDRLGSGKRKGQKIVPAGNSLQKESSETKQRKTCWSRVAETTTTYIPPTPDAMLVSTHELSLSHGDRCLAEIVILRMLVRGLTAPHSIFLTFIFPRMEGQGTGPSNRACIKSMNWSQQCYSSCVGVVWETAYLTDEATYKPRRTREVPKLEMLTRW